MRPPLPDVGHKRLIMTNDTVSQFLLFKYPMKPEEIREEVRALRGTDIGIFQWCIGTPMTARHRSSALESRGSQPGDYEHYIEWHLTRNMQHLIEIGQDSLDLVCDEGHRCAMQVWGSQRMNDRHHMYGLPDTWSLTSPFTREHPDCVLPDGGMNWLKQEIQDRVFNHLKEVATNYDVDGLDLDYTRIPPFFAEEEVEAGRASHTEFIRRVRAMLDEVGAQKGKRLGFSTQIYVNDPVVNSLDDAYNYGLDARRWVKEDLIDILIGHCRGKAVYELDCTEWLKAVKDTKAQLYMGPGKPARRHTTGPWGLRFYTLEEHRAIAANLHRQGVDGISFYDYMHHGPMDIRPFREMGSGEKLQFLNKVYVANPDLPLELGCSATGGQNETRLQFSDDIAAAIKAGYDPKARLLLNIETITNPEDVHVFLNGQDLGSPIEQPDQERHPFKNKEYGVDYPWFHLELKLDPALLKMGWNDIKLKVDKRHLDMRAPCRLMKLDLEIRYGEDRPQWGELDYYRDDYI